MAKALMCDNCDATVDVDAGEAAAWLSVGGGGEVFGREKMRFDACSRSCAHELLDGPIADAVDDWLETVMEVERTIQGEN